MSFNSHNNERPLGRTLRSVAAELTVLTQRIAILRYWQKDVVLDF